MRKTLQNPLLQRVGWDNLKPSIALSQPGLWNAGEPSQLQEIQDFGSNPGALRMYAHVPTHRVPTHRVPTHRPPDNSRAPLVVVLHGCAQTAAGYDRGAGWSTLARRYGFALLFPEQQGSNNPNGCFNWFQSGDIERGQGEAQSIRQMIDAMIADHGIDPRRIFITGLSAGGAMASVMLATYPEVFAGGGIIAGLPYGAATNVQQAFASMSQCQPRPARVWGELVRRASPHAGAWPRISVWHGGADMTVVPSNADEIVKQWTNLHGLAAAPSFTENVDGFPRRVWRSADGEEVIESYTIPSMAHGTPIAVGADGDQCGVAGAFLLDVGISSSYHIAKFWGLADSAVAASLDQAALAAKTAEPPEQKTPARPTKAAFDPVADARTFDVGAVIANALKAAGLMKSP